MPLIAPPARPLRLWASCWRHPPHGGLGRAPHLPLLQGQRSGRTLRLSLLLPGAWPQLASGRGHLGPTRWGLAVPAPSGPAVRPGHRTPRAARWTHAPGVLTSSSRPCDDPGRGHVAVSTPPCRALAPAPPQGTGAASLGHAGRAPPSLGPRRRACTSAHPAPRAPEGTGARDFSCWSFLSCVGASLLCDSISVS